MKKSVDVLAVGVGGQGIIRFSDILAEAAFRAGNDVKKSEIHGMSQRGGSVTSFIRWGAEIHSPVILDGEAHFILGLEKLETLRYAHFVSPGGKIITNDLVVNPGVLPGGPAIPDDLEEQIRSYAELVLVPATDIALKIGNKKAANTVMLGAFSRFVEIPPAVWDGVLRESFPEAIRQLNLDAFQAGREAV
jgi:indolepyruvate ferredoxin oxidoreductase beta subunit